MPTPIDLVVVGLKATLVLAMAGLVAGSLRRGAAATRHLVWTLGVVAALLLPTLHSLTPRWEMPLLPSSLRAAVLAPAASAAMTPAPGLQVARTAVHTAARAASSPSPAPPAASSRPSFDVSTLLLSLWLAGALAVAVPLVVAAARVRWLGRRATVLDSPAWSALASDLARSLGLARPVRLLQGGPETMPMAWGVLRPVVLLPRAADEWPESQRRAVLTHEMAHVKRHDCLTQAAAHVACSVYWFHPLVWLAARRLRVEREHACDDLVLRSGASGPDYADQLLQLARSARWSGQSLWAAVAMARPSQLEGRLLAILDPSLDRRGPSRRGMQLTVVAASFLVVLLAGLEPWARPALAAHPVDQAYDVAPATGPSPASPTPAMAAGKAPDGGGKPDKKYARRHEPETEAETRDLDERVSPPSAQVVAALAGAVHDADAEVRKEAVFSLGQLRASQGAAALASALTDEDAEVRAQAAFALGQIRSEAAVGPLTQALRDKEAEVRQQAAFALGQIRSTDGVPGLLDALKDSSAEVRQQAAFALGQLRDERAAEALTAALKDSQAEVRRQAAFALGQIAR